MMPKNPERFWSEVQDEYDFQRREFGNAHDDSLSCNEWIAILARTLGLAASDRAHVDVRRFRRQMIRLAATAISAIEALDRRPTDKFSPKEGNEGRT